MSKIVVKQLKKMLRVAKFEKASFGSAINKNPHNLSEKDIDTICKEQTKMYREAWLIPLINELIDYHENKISAAQLTAYTYPD